MTGYLVDTDVVSNLDPARRFVTPNLAAWLKSKRERLQLSVVTVFEVRSGILQLERRGFMRRARELRGVHEVIVASFASHTLDIDTDVALAAAEIAEIARSVSMGLPDLFIAATAKVHGLAVLTRNLRHFRSTGVPAFDPFTEPPPHA